MNSRIVSAILACLLCHAASAEVDWLIVKNLTLIDGTGAEPVSTSELVIREGRIVAISNSSPMLNDSVNKVPGVLDVVTTIDVGGRYVIPGLIDSHVHLSGFPGDREGMEQRMQQALRGGVTSVRDMAGDTRALADTERAIARGEFAGLTVSYSALFGGPGMFKDPRITLASVGVEPGTAPWARAIDPNTDLVRVVAEAHGTGATGIKIYGNLSGAEVRRIGAEVKRQGMAVWAHSTVFSAGPFDLLDAGVEVLSHAPYLVWAAADAIPDDYGARRQGDYAAIPPDHPRIIKLLRRMARDDVLLDTTLLIYRDAIQRAEGAENGAWATEAFNWGTRLVQQANQMGVKIASGTDRFLPDDWSLPDIHEEMAVLVEASGLSPMQALISATAHGARAARLPDRGTLQVGKSADLVVLGGNPLVDIRATQDIVLVVKDGKIVHKQQPVTERD